MLKHRGFPGRLASTDFQFTLRRANPKGATPLIRRERKRDRKPADRRADLGFMKALWEQFGTDPFERGNQRGKILLSGCELLVIDEAVARASFPEAFDGSSA